ncbi:MAG: hypothetical protein DMG76_13280 [Acidobacteria bacterium]|nr:MAG: hypothetical protein DMG76_13280 [Acidobacteriota bacterium]
MRRLSGVRGRRKFDRGISGSGTNGQKRYRSRAVHVFGCGARTRRADCPSESTCQFSSAKRGIFLACRARLRSGVRPSVHQMILTLEGNGLIERTPGQARSIRLLIPREDLPDLV